MPASALDPQVRGGVEFIDVARTFGEHRAVDNLTLSIRPGEFISLLGPSGCGKTTTLRMLAGFDFPDEGEILISGRPVRDVPPNKRDVNTVFQSYALFPHMSVADNVAYGLRQRGVDKSELRHRVAEALEMVQMLPLARRRPQSLSGGQQQRVALARALINRPSVLLLDEPLAALDRKLREQMQIELKLIQTALAITFVFVTHDQAEALSMSDRIAVMLNGRIEQLADPSTIYESPSNAFVAGFIGQQNFFAGVARRADRTIVGDGWTVRTDSDFGANIADGGPVLATVRPESVSVSAGVPAAGLNSISGQLRGISHLGVNVQYVVEISPHHEVLALLPRSLAPAPDLGATVFCSWPPDRTQTFPADETRLAALSPND